MLLSPSFSECQVFSDIVFLIDTSPVEQSSAIIEFIKSVISAIYVDQGAAAIAIVSFGSDARVEVQLGSTTDKTQIISTLFTIQFIGMSKVLDFSYTFW